MSVSVQISAARLAVLFPGIGYTCDKPLLYFSARAAREHGYEVLPVPYGGFPAQVKGDPEKMQACFSLALEQTEKLLADVRWADYADILFFSKSIGTAVALDYARTHTIHARHILYTPLAETFRLPGDAEAAFHGTADPWARTEDIRDACAKRGIPLYLTEGANHSLETGRTAEDLRILADTIREAAAFLL